MSRKQRKLAKHRAWLALGTMTAYAAISASGRAQTPYPQNSSSKNTNAASAQFPAQQFDIHAGPLDVVLAQFIKATGISLTYSIPADTIPGFHSAGVSGLYPAPQALELLLANTGLSYSFGGQNTIIIGLQHADTVSVSGSIADSVALDRIPTPLIDTAQSITAIPKDVLAQQAATTLRDALRNAPGISLAAGEGGSQGDNLTIRGFTARNDIFLDGMRDFGSYYRDPFNYDQINVLEGPAGVQFGRGSTGGVVNQESKTPQLRPFINLDGAFGTDLTRRFTADINEPLPDFAHGSAVRLNIMGHESNVAERDVTENRRFGFAPTFAFGLQSPTRLMLDYFHFSENDIPDYGIPWYFNTVAPVARHNYYGFRDANFLKTDVDMATLKGEHDLAEDTLLRDQFRYANYMRKAQITEPQLNTATSGSITPLTPLEQVQVNRNQIAVDSTESFLWDQADVTLNKSLLGMKHLGVVGIEGGRETSDPVRPTFYAPQLVNGKVLSINTVPTASLLNPNENQTFSGTSQPSSNVHTTSTSVGVYVLDTIEIGKRWIVSGGGRWDRFNTDYKAANWAYPAPRQTTVTNSQFNRVDEKPTWRGALVFKPASNGSLYFAYGTSFNPSAETLSLSQGTANLPPEENQTYEFGSKWDLRGGRLALRASLFRTDKENAREVSPTNSLLYVLAGNQRVDGAEAVVQGHLTSRWELLSSYTYMHSEVVKSQFYPAAVGYPLANVPANLFNLWTEYRLPRGFEVGGGGNYVDSRTASSTVPLDPTTGLIKQVPSYIVFNAMATYEINERIQLQANVYNVGNRNYIDEIHPAHIVPGAGTSALFGMKFNF
ncbi:TonB-dependent siderophore receptor [Alloacidobacterium dinghuense]|uniref:TonB-dependent siderophore receptor n=1 Tax=Alloacidobacterium dinghuense TaxID=2763107 RepID=A0A7G8BDY2_9BACT|nr:TonB-dependent siderophore receptor [Alloacidobacterium dinghuense]QNI30752.1 TonB-dependent siderophore receptor [Alloacidobacterium dinghuense]